MKYTLCEIGRIYKEIDSECLRHTYCKDCSYNGYCLRLDDISVMVEDEKFNNLANSILQKEYTINT